MKYHSTRGIKTEYHAAEAILAGLAEDGGLLVPENIPKIDANFIESLVPMSYKERAQKILALFLSDYTPEELATCINEAYGTQFDTPKIAPLVSVGNTGVLELWHGATSAFKDMALQLLPRLMRVAINKTGMQEEILILVATSGDTGKAALEGFCDVPQIKIMAFYPQGGVSTIQQLQMTTQTGNNVDVVAVRGNFDDAQTGVKKMFRDAKFGETLLHKGVRLSSANSMNWGRLVPQITYYFSAYADMCKQKKIKHDDAINFVVPTGNFGDILAGYYAMRMGLPVGRLICASNSNHVLTDFLQTGIYDKRRTFYKTLSPSMDILVSSNLERLLYHVTEDAMQVKTWMTELNTRGYYAIEPDILQKIRHIFCGYWVDDTETKQTIQHVYKTQHYLMDTHTAVAWHAAEKYQEETQDTRPLIVLSTASPYKFAESVLEAIGMHTTKPDIFQRLDLLAKETGTQIPSGLAALRKKKILHNDVTDADGMERAVLGFLS